MKKLIFLSIISVISLFLSLKPQLVKAEGYCPVNKGQDAYNSDTKCWYRCDDPNRLPPWSSPFNCDNDWSPRPPDPVQNPEPAPVYNPPPPAAPVYSAPAPAVAPSSVSTPNTCDTATKYCGGMQNAYLCQKVVPALGQCAERCGISTDPECARKVGVAEGVRIEAHLPPENKTADTEISDDELDNIILATKVVKEERAINKKIEELASSIQTPETLGISAIASKQLAQIQQNELSKLENYKNNYEKAIIKHIDDAHSHVSTTNNTENEQVDNAQAAKNLISEVIEKENVIFQQKAEHIKTQLDNLESKSPVVDTQAQQVRSDTDAEAEADTTDNSIAILSQRSVTSDPEDEKVESREDNQSITNDQETKELDYEEGGIQECYVAPDCNKKRSGQICLNNISAYRTTKNCRDFLDFGERTNKATSIDLDSSSNIGLAVQSNSTSTSTSESDQSYHYCLNLYDNCNIVEIPFNNSNYPDGNTCSNEVGYFEFEDSNLCISTLERTGFRVAITSGNVNNCVETYNVYNHRVTDKNTKRSFNLMVDNNTCDPNGKKCTNGNLVPSDDCRQYNHQASDYSRKSLFISNCASHPNGECDGLGNLCNNQKAFPDVLCENKIAGTEIFVRDRLFQLIKSKPESSQSFSTTDLCRTDDYSGPEETFPSFADCINSIPRCGRYSDVTDHGIDNSRMCTYPDGLIYYDCLPGYEMVTNQSDQSQSCQRTPNLLKRIDFSIPQSFDLILTRVENQFVFPAMNSLNSFKKALPITNGDNQPCLNNKTTYSTQISGSIPCSLDSTSELYQCPDNTTEYDGACVNLEQTTQLDEKALDKTMIILKMTDGLWLPILNDLDGNICKGNKGCSCVYAIGLGNDATVLSTIEINLDEQCPSTIN